jgi:hypothetical protein
MTIFAGTKLAKGFQTDHDAEQNGVWRVHPEFGIHVKIRRATLPEHKRALRKHYKPFAHLTRTDPKDELLVKQKAAAEVLVADWGQTVEDGAGAAIRGPLTKAGGEEIRPTQENVLAAFIEMPDFFDWVSAEADTFEHYRVAVVEASAGNSSRSSPGSESGERPAPVPFSNAEQPVASASAPSNAVLS